MKIVIVGWYGTETMGDRGILAGLIKSLIDAFGECELNIGSLNPFFTQRTLNEDYEFWKQVSGSEITVTIFDSTDAKVLRKMINAADVVAMGGGPLMHISELFMVEFALAYARKRKKKTAILGCGVGPIFNSKFHKPLLNIIKHSDIVILRDETSLEQLHVVANQYRFNLTQEICVSLDPAVIACHNFLEKMVPQKTVDEEKICINLRSFPSGYSSSINPKDMNEKLKSFVAKVSQNNSEKKIILVPMHYFHIGDDDRVFLNSIALDLGLNNIFVQNRPLSLFETLNLFAGAGLNVGMRFHSVVFQTLVSGNNYVLDYTEPKKGKISGFIQKIDHSGFYNRRYVNIQEDSEEFDITGKHEERFQIKVNEVIRVTSVYKYKLGNLF